MLLRCAKADDGHTLAFAPVYVMATPRFKGADFGDAVAKARSVPGSVSIASSGLRHAGS